MFYRYAIDYRYYGPDTNALGKNDGFYDLSADEMGIKITEILKEREKFWRMTEEEKTQYQKTHRMIDINTIQVRFWSTVGE